MIKEKWVNIILENNSLVKSDGILSKIARFFNSIFCRKYAIKENVKNEEINENKLTENSSENTLFYNERLAKKLLNEEISIDDLSDEEVQKMIAYFEKDIEYKDKEIERIKSHIVSMRNKQ